MPTTRTKIANAAIGQKIYITDNKCLKLIQIKQILSFFYLLRKIFSTIFIAAQS